MQFAWIWTFVRTAGVGPDIGQLQQGIDARYVRLEPLQPGGTTPHSRGEPGVADADEAVEAGLGGDVFLADDAGVGRKGADPGLLFVGELLGNQYMKGS